MAARKASKGRTRPSPIPAPRSPKAGRPPAEPAAPARVRRRGKTAHAAVQKDTTIHETDHGPRILWGRGKPKEKKR
jgi:hypothetical protein